MNILNYCEIKCFHATLYVNGTYCILLTTCLNCRCCFYVRIMIVCNTLVSFKSYSYKRKSVFLQQWQNWFVCIVIKSPKSDHSLSSNLNGRRLCLHVGLKLFLLTNCSLYWFHFGCFRCQLLRSMRLILLCAHFVVYYVFNRHILSWHKIK